jgi:hypothetical protein
MLFFDTSSTYWQTDRLPEELQDDDDREDGDVAPDDGEDGNGGQDDGTLLERDRRAYSAPSKDHRRDLPQVVVGMAVTRQGIPVRVWTFPGNASDQVIIRKVRDDLRGWNLSRVIWVLDRGFTSEQNRRYLQRAGGHYIVGEKLRWGSHEAKAALSRQGRYHEVHGGLRVKQVRVDDGTNRDRFVIAHNPERAVRDQVVREQILARLRLEIAAADKLTATKQAELYGALSTKPAFNPFLRRRRPASCGSTVALATAKRSSTASTCCAPATRASQPRTSRRLQGTLRSRARLARSEVHDRHAPRLPPPR